MKFQKCNTCGKSFLEFSQSNHAYCRICNKQWRKEQERKRKEVENLEWSEEREKNQQLFEQEIMKYDTVQMQDIKPTKDTLYIIGNGFDLMHRVPSSFYSFRDSLGKNNHLRTTLEMSLTPEDIWADFENSLAEMDMEMMGSSFIVDMWLEDSGFYEDDAGAAEFYMAVESAANPIISIVQDLSKCFRRWVNGLKIGTDDKPLTDLIRPDGKAINFNYTEFLETTYGVTDVCYIHGCRKNKNERLILGHRPGDEGTFEGMKVDPADFREAAVSIAQENVFDLYEQYDEELTKDSQIIIEYHRDFFDGLKDVDQIVVIGHSMSLIDWDYFIEINRASPKAHWYFGCFGLNDLKNMEALVRRLGIEDFDVFRTDGVETKPIDGAPEESPEPVMPRAKVYEKDGTVVAIDQVFNLIIDDDLELVLPSCVHKVVIIDEHIFILLANLNRTILLFGKVKGHWSFINDLKSFDNQYLINRRLKHVYLAEDTITFVYNNRIRKYLLLTGEMIENRQVKDARYKEYDGIDVIDEFIG